MAHFSVTPHHFEPLKSEHDLSQFMCENDYLVEFLQTKALQQQQLNHLKTYVCIDEDAEPERAVIGYFTLRASGFFLPHYGYFIPVIEIPALARREDLRGDRWGSVILSEALYIIGDTASLIGVAGVQLEPTIQGSKLYYRFGFSDHPIIPDYLYLPTTKIPRI